MAEKQSILGRITQLAKANINALLDRAEDPQKMLDQLVRDYTNSIVEAEEAVAQTIGNLRLAEKDYEEDQIAVREWGVKAIAASKKADEVRAAGREDEAAKWDALARTALAKQIDFEREVKEAEPVIATQRDVVEKLKSGLNQSRVKLEDLKTKRDQLIARQRTAEAQQKLHATVSSINVLDPNSELSRFEDRVRQQEAIIAGKLELAADSFEAKFEELEASADDLEIEARLAALKNLGQPRQIED
ncbi:PspA/IM30 family protein [Gleimia coleocanis DSM 15436]|uniref:PspA/IM30 family protein n=1 Tax=Gleimia coleocanis DSM 15436 TaxID=525245 RepID=C0VYL0_9ACTO|nr:PspA/IM30 family protein [Gleimia coleocanis]EEH64513.1 PspA/IM30 family protein [Gleimia coleocanis DSM 15436]